ncbi:MAG: CDP-alcohol phosphatidyltransferase family protein [Kiritimatiellae bacterium]|nr:CDP-alcohol phosphatidyltransferase family protein [Kiritimatiellia bacterium]
MKDPKTSLDVPGGGSTQPGAGKLHRTIVTLLTLSRLPLIFAFAAGAVAAEHFGGAWLPWIAGFFMGSSGISDFFDGKLARKWGVVSAFGKMADPLMDKVFFIVVFPTFQWLIGVQGENRVHAILMLVFTILWILRDQWVTFLRSVASHYGADVSAQWLGKVRTALSFPASGFIYAYLSLHNVLPECCRIDLWGRYWLWAVYAVETFLILLNAYSCFVYTKSYLPYLRRSTT